jgi:predicted nucleic acid-binding protein
MSFVLDASVTLAWLLPDETSKMADEIIEHLIEATALVPAIWTSEIGNVLIIATRRGRMTQQEEHWLLNVLQALPVDIEPAPSGRTLECVIDIANKHSVTAYDAAYLELAERHDLPLATLDKRLAAAAEAQHVRMLPHTPRRVE